MRAMDTLELLASLVRAGASDALLARTVRELVGRPPGEPVENSAPAAAVRSSDPIPAIGKKPGRAPVIRIVYQHLATGTRTTAAVSQKDFDILCALFGSAKGARAVFRETIAHCPTDVDSRSAWALQQLLPASRRLARTGSQDLA